MIPIVGVFNSRTDAESATVKLRAAGFSQENINILTPHSTDKELASVPQIQGEQPGMARTLGTVAGGATGFGIGEALATLLVPGVGPVLAIGVAAGTLLGALAGNTLGGMAEDRIFSGLPTDELFVYEDALRQGRTVLVVTVADKKEADTAKDILSSCGADSIDEARDKWWLGLRDVEKERYESEGGSFKQDERTFRRGFEAALQNSGRTYEQCRAELSGRYPDVWENHAFCAGFRRGQASRNSGNTATHAATNK